MSSHTDPDLIRAVNDVANAHGWAGTTAELIATAAGVNRTTLYRNGYTRERLLTEAVASMITEFEAATLPALTSTADARTRMTELLEALYRLADEHLGLVAGLYDGPTVLFHLGLDPDDTDVVTRMEYTAPFARVLADGNDDGTLHSDDPDADAELIFNTAGWTYVHLRRSHRWRSRRARDAVTRITLAGFLSTSD